MQGTSGEPGEIEAIATAIGTLPWSWSKAFYMFTLAALRATGADWRRCKRSKRENI